jgi:hypothetical protein
MPSSRRKISATKKSFIDEINRLQHYDANNQRNYHGSATRPSSTKLSKLQLHLLTEAIFFAGFRAYENFIRDIFLLYCMEKQPNTRKKVKSYLSPMNYSHTEVLIQSSMPFLDWSSPDTIIDRASIYLQDGYPIKLPLTTNIEALRNFKKLRNHIAHNSKESLDEYIKVVKRYITTIPLQIPSPGEILLITDRSNPTQYILLSFFELMKILAGDLA